MELGLTLLFRVDEGNLSKHLGERKAREELVEKDPSEEKTYDEIEIHG